MLPLFPIMIAITLIIIILQVRSISAMVMVFLTSPLGLIGVVPTLIVFQQPFGINALVGLIALSGILMRNTLILIGQIRHNEQAGLDPIRREGLRRLGDRDTRSDDRYLFLETVMSAREVLHLSYLGEGAHDGKPRNPAAPLAELLAALERQEALGAS